MNSYSVKDLIFMKLGVPELLVKNKETLWSTIYNPDFTLRQLWQPVPIPMCDSTIYSCLTNKDNGGSVIKSLELTNFFLLKIMTTSHYFGEVDEKMFEVYSTCISVDGNLLKDLLFKISTKNPDMVYRHPCVTNNAFNEYMRIWGIMN